MAIFSSKDFSGANTTRIRNAIAGITRVAAPATPQQCSDYVTKLLQRDTVAWEASQTPPPVEPD